MVYYRWVYVATIHDNYPISYIDNLLEQLTKKESYSFTDGFSINYLY